MPKRLRAKASRECPNCKSTRVVPIAYGFPTAETVELAQNDRVHLGGCCIDAGMPTAHCLDCGGDWVAALPKRSRSSGSASNAKKPPPKSSGMLFIADPALGAEAIVDAFFDAMRQEE